MKGAGLEDIGITIDAMSNNLALDPEKLKTLFERDHHEPSWYRPQDVPETVILEELSIAYIDLKDDLYRYFKGRKDVDSVNAALRSEGKDQKIILLTEPSDMTEEVRKETERIVKAFSPTLTLEIADEKNEELKK